jgi:hypothetical protein
MAARALKNIAPVVEPHATQASTAPARLSPTALRKLAAGADPTQPPAVMPLQASSTLITMRIQTSLADAIADMAAAEGTTQKVIITRALAAAGFAVPPPDLEDRTPRRRRGAA